MSELSAWSVERLPQLVNANERLVWRGRYVDTTFLLEVGDVPWLIKISAGRIVSVTRGPFVEIGEGERSPHIVMAAGWG